MSRKAAVVVDWLAAIVAFVIASRFYKFGAFAPEAAAFFATYKAFELAFGFATRRVLSPSTV